MFNRVAILLAFSVASWSARAGEPPLPQGAIARLGSVRWRNLVDTSVGAKLFFAADGKTVIAPTSGVLRAIDFATGDVTWEVREFRAEATFSLLPDGRLLMSERGGLRIFDPVMGKETHRTGSLVTAFQHMASNGRLVACGKGNVTVVLEIATGKELWRFGDQQTPNSPLAFVKGRPELIIRELRDGGSWIRVLDTNTQKSLREWKLPVLARRTWVPAGLSPDGKLLFTTGDKNVHLWTVATGKEYASLAGHIDEVIAGAFTADSKLLVTSSKDKTLRWWDVATGKELGKIDFGKWAWTLAVSPDGQRVAAVFGGSNALHRFDLTAGRELPIPDGHTNAIEQLAFLPDGSALLSAGRDGVVRVWDLKSQQTIRSLKPKVGPARWLAVSPDSNLAATASYNESVVRLWEIASGKELRSMRHPGQGIGCIAFTPNGNAILSGGHDFAPEAWPVIVWDVKTGKQIKQIPGHAGGTWGISFLPDGRQFVTRPGELTSYAGDDNQATAHLRNLETGRAYRLQGRWDNAVTVSPNGRSVAITRQPSPGKIELVLVELASGVERLKFAQAPFGGPLAFLPDGRVLATKGPHQSHSNLPGVYFWDTATGDEIRHFDAGQVSDLAFSPDGKMLATGGVDGTILLWDASRIRAKAPVSNATPDSLWADLASDAPKTYQAIVALSSQGERGVKLLHERLKPAVTVDARHLDQLLTGLESPQFAVREKADLELAALFERAEPALRERLKKTTSAEARKSISRLLEKIDSGWLTQSERLREVRAIEVLERIDSASAKSLLEDLAKGDPFARLTGEAKAALKWKERLGSRRK